MSAVSGEWPMYPVVAKTCLKCRQALMNVAKQSRNMAMSSACSSSVPLTTLRNNGRSPACVIVLDMPRNMFATSCRATERAAFTVTSIKTSSKSNVLDWPCAHRLEHWRIQDSTLGGHIPSILSLPSLPSLLPLLPFLSHHFPFFSLSTIPSLTYFFISVIWFAFVHSIVVFVFVCCIWYSIFCVCLSPNWLYVSCLV